MMATDEEIQWAILEALQQDSSLSPHDIEVQVHQQQVTLRSGKGTAVLPPLP
jgi:osmotically-inducible protein OsmY